MDEAVAAAALMAETRTQNFGERPNRPTLKPPKPPTYEGARQGTFTQWAFQVKQYIRLMNVHDEAYSVEFVAGLFRGSAALWWQNLIGGRG